MSFLTTPTDDTAVLPYEGQSVVPSFQSFEHKNLQMVNRLQASDFGLQNSEAMLEAKCEMVT